MKTNDGKKGLEKSVSNFKTKNTPVLYGASLEAIFPVIGVFPHLLIGLLETHLRHHDDNEDYFFGFPDLKNLHLIKNTAKYLIGATVVSTLRYFF